MSVIGPRPQLVRDLVFMSKEERKRHTVRLHRLSPGAHQCESDRQEGSAR